MTFETSGGSTCTPVRSAELLTGSLLSQVPALRFLVTGRLRLGDYRWSARISASAAERFRPAVGAGMSTRLCRAGRARPEVTNSSRRESGFAFSRATGCPRSVLVMSSPQPCFNANTYRSHVLGVAHIYSMVRVYPGSNHCVQQSRGEPLGL